MSEMSLCFDFDTLGVLVILFGAVGVAVLHVRASESVQVTGVL